MTSTAPSEARPKRRSPRPTARHLAVSRTMDFHRLADLLPNDTETRAKARTEAATRGWTVEQLARRILETVMEDDLVSAVLDDAAPGRRSRR